MNDLKYAGFWARSLATMIDSIVILLVVFPLMFVVYGQDYFQRSNSLGFLDIFFTNIFPILAVVLCWKLWGATPGKMLLGMQIVDAITLEPPSTGQLVGRYFAYIVSYLPFCLGILWICFDGKKQGWHDKLSNTTVVYSHSLQGDPLQERLA